jgi:hypothetical protein
MLLLAAVNLMFLGLDTYLAHVLNGTIRAREWIPILFGPIAGLILLIAGLIALRRRPLASTLVTLTFLSSILIGILGAYFHIVRGSLPAAPAGQRITVGLLIWAPPILAPFAFAGVGVLGLSAAWVEDPPGSGTLQLSFGRRINLPYSKTRAYFFLVSLGTLVALISSVLDHAREPWTNPWLWLPTAAGIFGVVASAGMGTINQPSRGDLYTYLAAMVILILTGVIGAIFHISADLTSQSVIIAERFLRGAPFLAPLLYSNMGLVGLAALLDPEEHLNP